MKSDSILKYNKIIASFVGGKELESGYFIPYHGITNMDSIEIGSGKTARFHSSWDWLMLAVENIKKVGLNDVIISRFETEIVAYNLNDEELFRVTVRNNTQESTSLTTTYKAVLRFIEWYNE